VRVGVCARRWMKFSSQRLWFSCNFQCFILLMGFHV